MANIVIIGTQWGDEGKGKIVDLLAADADIIARFQGGANAGFNVNWDADWVVRTQRTAAGWEAEFAIPLKTFSAPGPRLNPRKLRPAS